jgi:multidrug efflux pump
MVKSVSRERVSQITVEFVPERNVDAAANDVRDRVARVRALLPEAADDSVVSKIEADAQAIMWLAFNSERHDTLELSDYADRYIADRLKTLPGVASVIIGGNRRYAMRWLDRDRLAAYALTPGRRERAAPPGRRLPAGRIGSSQREFTILAEADFRTAEQFNNMIVTQSAATVRLRTSGPRAGRARRAQHPRERPRGGPRHRQTSTANTRSRPGGEPRSRASACQGVSCRWRSIPSVFIELDRSRVPDDGEAWRWSWRSSYYCARSVPR